MDIPSLSDPQKAAQTIFEQRLGISEQLIRKTLQTALSSSGSFAELYFQYTLSESVVLEENLVKSSSQSLAMGVGIRVLKGEQTGYAYSESFDERSMQKAASSAAQIASGGRVNLDDAQIFNQSVPKNYYSVQQTIHDLQLAEKIRYLRIMEQEAQAFDERITKITATFSNSLEFIQIVNSNGLFLRDSKPMFRMYAQCLAQEKDNRQVAGSGVGGRVGLDFLQQKDHAIQIAKEAASRATLLLEAQQAPSGTLPVVLGAGQSGILLHEAIGHPLEADFNRKGSSAYSGRIGEKVASDLCTIYDSGQFEYDRGAINFDDEGNFPKETVLIENGILRGYMQDHISAQSYQVKPSGNGRRESFAHYPLPRMTTTYLNAGKSDPDEIIASVEKGVYCESFSGGQVNISNGDFVFVPVIAYMIEQGKKTVPIKNFTLIGNGPDVMTKLVMAGNDFKLSEGIWTCGKDGQGVPVGVGLPTVLISEMTIGGA